MHSTFVQRYRTFTCAYGTVYQHYSFSQFKAIVNGTDLTQLASLRILGFLLLTRNCSELFLIVIIVLIVQCLYCFLNIFLYLMVHGYLLAPLRLGFYCFSVVLTFP